MDKLTRFEKAFARSIGVTAKDVHKDGANSCGTVYALYIPYYYERLTVSGYTKPEIYRLLLRDLIKNAMEIAT